MSVQEEQSRVETPAVVGGLYERLADGKPSGVFSVMVHAEAGPRAGCMLYYGDDMGGWARVSKTALHEWRLVEAPDASGVAELNKSIVVLKRENTMLKNRVSDLEDQVKALLKAKAG